MLPMRDGRTNERTTSEYRATQLLICEKLSLAIGGGGEDDDDEDDDFCSHLEITDNTAASESCQLCYVSAEIACLKLYFSMYKTSP